jgi:ATP-binding cassette subfamily C protein CydC
VIKHRISIFFSSILSSLAFLGGIGLTVASAWLITMAAEHPPILTLEVAIVLVRFFGLFRSLARYSERVVSHESVLRSLTDLRVKLFDSLSRQEFKLVKDLSSGVLVKSLVDDVDRVQEYQLRVTLPRYSSIITLTSACFIAFWIHPRLLIVFLPATVVLLFVIPQITQVVCQEHAKLIEKLENSYSRAISDSYFNLYEAKIFGYADTVYSSLQNIENDLRSVEKKLIHLIFLLQLFTLLILGSAIAGSIWIMNNLNTIGSFPSVKISMGIFLSLVAFEAVVAWYPNLYASGKLDVARQNILELLSSENSPKLLYRPSNYHVSLHDMTAYWDKDFMKPISLSIAPGESLVLRGRSGAGKSTLALAMCGVLPYRGSALIGGVEISECEDLTRYVSASLQRGHVFNTSVRENLKIADPQVSDQEILSVLKLVELDYLPLDTLLGDFGRNLSGGESKRLSVARALLSRAPIVILDEPTEHLEAALAARIESRITELIQKSMRTLIVITHSGWHNSTRLVLIERE